MLLLEVAPVAELERRQRRLDALELLLEPLGHQLDLPLALGRLLDARALDLGRRLLQGGAQLPEQAPGASQYRPRSKPLTKATPLSMVVRLSA